jgi:hypothetical protein
MVEWCFECEEHTPWKIGNVAKCAKCGTEETWTPDDIMAAVPID